MSNKPTYKVKLRRRRKGFTDYKKRLALLKSKQPRLVVRKRNKSIIVQIVNYEPQGDKTLITFSSIALKKLGWKGHCGNLPSAYLSGYACAKKAFKAGIKKAVLDIGVASPVHGSAVFTALMGALDAGLEIPLEKEVLPTIERASGKHIGEETAKNFAQVKDKIDKEF
ncbi:MAG: 50S ribosomal protein L18 [Candidatus Diapherotrites archaeon]